MARKQTNKSTNNKKKVKKNILTGSAYVHSTRNNTIITIADESGNALSWASSGSIGYKGSKKSTPYAAGIASENAAKQAMVHGVKTVKVFVKGTGQGKDTAVRSLQTAGLDISEIKDVTPIAHNGVKAPKRRR